MTASSGPNRLRTSQPKFFGAPITKLCPSGLLTIQKPRSSADYAQGEKPRTRDPTPRDNKKPDLAPRKSQTPRRNSLNMKNQHPTMNRPKRDTLSIRCRPILLRIRRRTLFSFLHSNLFDLNLPFESFRKMRGFCAANIIARWRNFTAFFAQDSNRKFSTKNLFFLRRFKSPREKKKRIANAMRNNYGQHR